MLKLERHVGLSVVVAFTERARRGALERYGMHDVVITWSECQALCADLEKFGEVERAVEMAKALRFFANRQGLDLVLRLVD